MADFVSLPDISRECRIDYQQVYRAAVSGLIPVQRIGRGRGYYAARKEDLGRIARHFGVRIDAGQGTA